MKNTFTYKTLKKLLKQRKKGKVHIENDFLREALEGYEIFPESLNNFQKLRKKALIKQGFKPRFFYPVFSVVLVSIISIALLFFNGKRQDKNSSLFSAQKKQEKNSPSTTYNEFNHFKTLSTEENHYSNPYQKPQFQNKEKIDDCIKAIPLSNCSIKIMPDSSLDNKQHKIIYLGDFKCIDYTYPKNYLPTKPLAAFPGLDAMHENYERRNSLSGNLIAWEIIPYKDYLKMAFDYLKNQKFNKALMHLNTINHQYPNDLNALFYSAYIYYLKEDFDKALILFKELTEKDKLYFDQEAMWYLALSHEKLGHYDEAENLFLQIHQENNFYGDAAAEKISSNHNFCKNP